MSRVEFYMERLLLASRWLMAPFYCGLVITLFVLMIKFCQELFAFLPNMFEAKETALIVWILTLIDLSLAGNLLLIVIFSGFENFVSKMDIGDHEDKPSWMGKVDFGGMKLKLVASIVAISAIQLLKTFMNIHAVSENEALNFWTMRRFSGSESIHVWICAVSSAEVSSARYRARMSQFCGSLIALLPMPGSNGIALHKLRPASRGVPLQEKSEYVTSGQGY